MSVTRRGGKETEAKAMDLRSIWEDKKMWLKRASVR